MKLFDFIALFLIKYINKTNIYPYNGDNELLIKQDL